MARPHVEFLQSQCLPWTAAPGVVGGPAADWKVLSEDDATGAVSAVVRWPAAARVADRRLACDLEVFVLQGALDLGPAFGALETHGYAYVPAGSPVAPTSRAGAVALVYTDRTPAPAGSDAGVDEAARIGPVDTRRIPWDASNVDPNINHLRAARKNLRLDPAGRCRTYLLGGPPHGFPPGGTPAERHPHVEEFFLVAGDISFHVGTMRPGAYFWRPPGLAHGQDSTLTGYLLFCRTPGSNRTITEWSDERYPVDVAPEYRPILPPALAAVARAQPDPVSY